VVLVVAVVEVLAVALRVAAVQVDDGSSQFRGKKKVFNRGE